MKKNFSRNASRLLWGIPLAAIAALLLFAPVMTSAAGPTIRQGTTTTYGILAGSTITNTGATTISGTAGGDVSLTVQRPLRKQIWLLRTTISAFLPQQF